MKLVIYIPIIRTNIQDLANNPNQRFILQIADI